MSNILVSIIVPVYNVEKYLAFCVESLVKQTYKNIEILLIDDGSTDKSGKIADEWAERDSRIKVFHKENGGLSDARNFGVRHASSDWIMFIDSDDYYELFAVEYLVRIKEKYNADLIATALKGVSKHNSFENREITERDISDALHMSKYQALEEMFYSKRFSSSACGKLINKELLLQNAYPKDKLFEDMATTYKHIHNAKNIYIAPIKIYGYFKREGSIVNSKFNEKYLYILDIINDIHSFLNKEYNDNSIKKAANVRSVFLLLELGNTLLRSGMYVDLRDIRERIWHYKYDFFVNSRVSLKNKIKSLLFLFFPTFYNYIRVKLLN